jgi:hypothetical protein
MIAGPKLATTIECDPADSRMFSDQELAEVVAEVALAVLTCSVLQAIAPKVRTTHRREA